MIIGGLAGLAIDRRAIDAQGGAWFALRQIKFAQFGDNATFGPAVGAVAALSSQQGRERFRVAAPQPLQGRQPQQQIQVRRLFGQSLIQVGNGRFVVARAPQQINQRNTDRGVAQAQLSGLIKPGQRHLCIALALGQDAGLNIGVDILLIEGKGFV